MPTKTAPRSKAKAVRQPVTAEDLREFVLISDPQIAPAGDAIVFVNGRVGEKNDYVKSLWRVETDGGEPRPFTGGTRDTQPRWSPDGSRIAFVRAAEKTRPQIAVIDAAGGEATNLTKLPEGSIGGFRWSPDGRTLAVTFREQDPEWTEAAKKERAEQGLSDPPRVLDHWWYRLDGDGYFNAQRFQLYLIDAATGDHRRIYAGDTLGFFSFDFAPDGKQIVVATNRQKRAGLQAWNDDLLKVDIASGRATRIPNLPAGPKTAVAWSPDGSHIAFAGRRGDDNVYSTENLELWVCNARTGRGRSLTRREDYCLLASPMSDTAEVAFDAEFRWHPDGKRLFMQIGWHGECHVASIARSGGAITFHTSGPHVHRLGNVSKNGRRLAMTVGSTTTLDEVHLAEITGVSKPATLTPLTTLNRAYLRSRRIAKPTSHWIKSADGNPVQVWVMLPPGVKNGRKLPSILEIHGGPHAQYGVGFFHEFQVLAGAGYAVFYSNPRGSKGYGRDFCNAIRGRWGHDDWTDLQAVIGFMKEHRSVNPKRMGVMGGSYGGYMTNWVIGHNQNFAGAITDRCVSNIVHFGGTSDFLAEPDRYFPGSHWENVEARWEQSPIKHIGSAKTPTLIIHSEGDLRCNIEQGEQVYTALTLLKVPTRFVRYPRSTSHGMSRCGPPDMRLHRLAQILDWWKEWL